MSNEKQPDSQPNLQPPDPGWGKVFLLHTQEQDDLDIIYGVFSTREKAEAEKSGPQYLISCATITELTLDELLERE